jgi:histone deacetylase 6
MEEEDSVMGEDSIINSTEPNGDDVLDTVNPSDVFPNIKGPTLSKREQLPFHSPSKNPSFLQPNTTQSQAGSLRTTKSPSGWSDRMSMSRPTPVRRPSPEVRIPPKPRSSILPYATNKTGLLYDSRMRFHAELPDMDLIDDIHPEDPRRIHSIYEELRRAGLVATSDFDEDQEDKCWRIMARFATRPEILLIHTEEHYAFVESLQRKSMAASIEHN